ncbi:hypothetical protein B296_00002790 [Ensete ventricosum]|uniref:Uncharacterized protein n=1 Tax=Ensete ventricosum TaxID=4639 RepID=A0A427B194_ENSVE|nr:hypothetical protein B296_00002790 [Ensete ventricosum]
MPSTAPVVPSASPSTNPLSPSPPSLIMPSSASISCPQQSLVDLLQRAAIYRCTTLLPVATYHLLFSAATSAPLFSMTIFKPLPFLHHRRCFLPPNHVNGVELRCRLDLFSSECATPPMSVGVETSCVDLCSLGSPRRKAREAPPMPKLEGIPNDPLGRVKFGVVGKRESDHGREPILYTCCRSKCFIHVGGELARTPSLTFVVPRNMTETYGGRAAAATWGEGMTRHATLIGVG